MKIFNVIILVITLASAGQARSQGGDGSFFLSACSATQREFDNVQLSKEDEAISMYCAAYVSGFLDGMSLTLGSSNAKRVVCLPEKGISNEQAVRVFVKFLRANPETLHQTGRMSFFIALAKAFPCGK
jgi:hypothetical protein